MATDLSPRNIPDDVARRLKERARLNRRSVPLEVLAILENAVGEPRRPSIDEVLAQVRRLGLQTPNESARLIRADRDSRYR